jgi:hypothetical protein
VPAAADAGVLVTGLCTMTGAHPTGPALVLAFACLTPDLLGEALIRVVGVAEALSRPPDRRRRPSQDPCHPSKRATRRAAVVMM